MLDSRYLVWVLLVARRLVMVLRTGHLVMVLPSWYLLVVLVVHRLVLRVIGML